MAAGPRRVKDFMRRRSSRTGHLHASGLTARSFGSAMASPPKRVQTPESAMPRLNRIIETALYVDDLERAAAFYENVLEVKAMLRTKTLYAYDIGGSSVLLLFHRGESLSSPTSPNGTIPPHDGSGPLHICFAVDAEELPAWETRLNQHGVTIEGRMTWERGGESLYLRDPDGHLLELMSPGVWTTY
jgi:catechol 2,3-dioxygenase-like lactoylglutathione lyase family enzyme